MITATHVTTGINAAAFSVCSLFATIGAVDVITEETLIPVGLVATGVVGLLLGVWKVATKLQKLLDKIDTIAVTTTETQRIAGSNSNRLSKVESQCAIKHP